MTNNLNSLEGNGLPKKEIEAIKLKLKTSEANLNYYNERVREEENYRNYLLTNLRTKCIENNHQLENGQSAIVEDSNDADISIKKCSLCRVRVG